jgi:hypothetical protein
MAFTPIHAKLKRKQETAPIVPPGRVERRKQNSVLARMNMPAPKDWSGIPAEMRMLLLHVRRSERDRMQPYVPRPIANDPEPPIVIQPIAHRRMS